MTSRACRRVGVAVLASSWVWGAGTPARAAEPTKKECVAANETGQDLRQSGKLEEARAALAVCMAERCPRPVREDCAQRLAEIEAELPTLVFAAKDGAGHDLSAVRVSVDGKPLLDSLGGTATAIDPGEYLFTFEADGLPTTATSVVVREGDKNRRVQVVLGALIPPAKDEATAPAPLPAAETVKPSNTGVFGGSTQRTLGFGLGVGGVVGVVAGAVLGLTAKSTYDRSVTFGCAAGSPAGPCSSQGTSDRQSAFAEATGSTVAFIAGGALLAGGAVLYFTAPSGNVTVAPSVTASGVGLGVGGAF